MARIGVFGYLLFGQVHYLSILSAELARRGHALYFFSGNKYKELIRRRSLQHCSYPDEVE